MNSINIRIKRIEEINEDCMNSLNHWEHLAGKPPTDYLDTSISFDKYIDLFHPFYLVVNLSPQDMIWIKQAHKIGKITASFPGSYKEELQDTVERFNGVTFPTDESQGYFVKTCQNSLKSGMHGVGPYTNMRMILESMCTTTHFHSAIESKLFLLPWKKQLINDFEFRIFVYQGKITAISQQHWGKRNITLRGMRDEDIHSLASNIVLHFEKKIKPKVNSLAESFVMDFAYLGTLNMGEMSTSLKKLEPYFIEMNPWGKEYGAGSALFHWLIDEDILYSDGKQIEFRLY
jgi:hypothetical protein